jgi:hypothetical protein
MSSVMLPAAHGLARFRQWTAAAWLFVAFILLSGAERRLAEAHLNDQSSAPGIENNDALDGDEIRVRLVLLGDAVVPTLACVEERLEVTEGPGRVSSRLHVVREARKPRAPPVALPPPLR